MAELNDYLLLGGILFAFGVLGVIVRRNIIIMLMSIELALSGGLLTMLAFSRYHLTNGLPEYSGRILCFFVLAVAAAEVAIGLSIILALHRSNGTVLINSLNKMKG